MKLGGIVGTSLGATVGDILGVRVAVGNRVGAADDTGGNVARKVGTEVKICFPNKDLVVTDIGYVFIANSESQRRLDVSNLPQEKVGADSAVVSR